MARLRHGVARIEFLAVKDEITVLLEKGKTYSMIYEEMKQKNAITMSYNTFRCYLNGTRKIGTVPRKPKAQRDENRNSSKIGDSPFHVTKEEEKQSNISKKEPKTPANQGTPTGPRLIGVNKDSRSVFEQNAPDITELLSTGK